MSQSSPGQLIHGLWTSRFIFVLAAVGSAIGLGNIWKFPYLVGMNGGGAFVLVYLLCMLLLGVPLMMAEIMIGRRARRSPVNAIATLAKESGASKRWVLVGWLGTLAAFLILSFYTVIAGWALHYTVLSAAGTFTGATAEQSAGVFDGLQMSWSVMLLWHTVFVGVTVWVVARGVQKGLEQAVRLLMPLLFLLLLVLLGYAISTGHFMEGVKFLFTPDFSKIDGHALVAALGQVFFSLSLGMGAMMAYGAYMSQEQSVATASVQIVLLDTIFSLVIGLALFPIVFAWQLEPAQGPGLMFVTLPLAFGNLPLGALFGALFFGLVVAAAWTSTISLMEPFAAWAVEKGVSRKKATALLGAAVWALGILSVLSFNVLAGDQFRLGGKTFFESLDFLTSNIMLPISGILVAVFAGWVMKDTKVMKELAMKSMPLYLLWRVAIRIVVPLCIGWVFLDFMGVF